MPWEKSFDESDVLEQAMEVFWEKGYAATSISDITEATGIKRGSLYNAFAGKDDLFLQSLLKYDSGRRKERLRQLEQIDDPRESISKLFDFAVKRALKDPDKKGCLLINTALECQQRDDEVQKIVRDASREMSAFFEKQIRRGQKQGVIPSTIKPRETGRALYALLVGIIVLGRGTFGKTALQQMAAQAVQLIS